MKRASLLLLLMTLLDASSSVQAASYGVPTWQRASSMLPGASGGLVGMAFEGTNLAQYAQNRLGRVPGSMGTFTMFPVIDSNWVWIDMFLKDCAEQGMVCILTIEPFAGLQAVTAEATLALARRIVRWEAWGGGAKVIVRFAHEMNGGWYAWGQRPSLYREKFRLVASIIHSQTCRATMMWAPNTGCGYPWRWGGASSTNSHCSGINGPANLTDCDANGDGVVDEGDAFIPYYPGNKYVDWVGLSIYHMGDNNRAPATQFVGVRSDGVTQTCRGNMNTFYRLFSSDAPWRMAGDASAMDVTRAYATRLQTDRPPAKSLVIGETASRYSLCDAVPKTARCTAYTGVPTELEIKESWWQQVFGNATIRKYPRMRIVQWFDIRKSNEFEGNTVDWTLTLNPVIRQRWLTYLQSPAGGSGYWKFNAPSNADITKNMCMDFVPGAPEPAPPPQPTVAPAPPVYQWYQLRPSHIADRSKCISAGTSTAAPAQMWPCDPLAYSVAPLLRNYRIRTVLKNATTNIVTFIDGWGRCLEVANGSLTNDARFILAPCVPSAPRQHMRLSPAGYQVFVLIAMHSGRCAGVQAGSTQNGATIVQGACWRSPNQVFEMRAMPLT